MLGPRFPLTPLAAISLGLALGCTSPSGGPGTPLPRLSFSELDANGDGAIDPEEFRKLSDALFERLDADGDGKISEAEYKQAAEQHRSPHHPHHGGGGRQGGSGGWPGGGGGGGWPGGGGGPY